MSLREDCVKSCWGSCGQVNWLYCDYYFPRCVAAGNICSLCQKKLQSYLGKEISIVYAFHFLQISRQKAFEFLLVADYLGGTVNDNGSSFVHNLDTIMEAFSNGNAMIIRDEDNLVGFMTWESQKEDNLHIDIVEIVPKYRRDGICSVAIGLLYISKPDTRSISADVLPQSREAFRKMGFIGSSDLTTMTKTIKNVKRHKGD